MIQKKFERSNHPTARLQEDLVNLAVWSNDWQMLFNVDKCKVMHMGYNNTCPEYFRNVKKWNV